MTLEQFQATRKTSDDLAAATGNYYDEGAHTGFLYEGNLCIENVLDTWPEATRRAGKYYLQIGNQEFISDDLADLERRLFDYGKSEGIC
jgi:hypothetical protein